VLLPATSGYIPPSQDNGDIPNDATRERPHTIIERAEREFAQRSPSVFGPEITASSAGAAGTVSVDEARHPLSGKGERLIEKGQQYASAGDHRKAIDEFKKALNERSSAPYAHSLLGVEYLKTKNFPAAIDQLRAAVLSLPNVSVNHSNLGYAYCLTGKREAAERELREAIRLDSVAPQPQYLLGLLLLDAKSPEAGQHLQFAQRIIKKARLALAIFHTRHGESDAAQKDLRAYLGPAWPQEAENAEEWVVLAAQLDRPSVVFGMPEETPATAGAQARP
jgi:tetratricopeptide (TPR) repeat protein